MKRIYAFGLFMTMLLGLAFNANSAMTMTFKWDNPGSVEIKVGNSSGEALPIPANVTEYTVSITDPNTTYTYVYVLPTQEYRIIKGVNESNNSETLPSQYTGFLSYYLSASNALNGATIDVTTEKVVRDESFTIDVVNGLEYLTAKFTSGYTLNLQEGSHNYTFNPSYDKTLTISLTEVKEAFSVTLNGQKIDKNYFRPAYEEIKIAAGDVLTIQVYEDTPPQDCTFTLDYSEGMEGCLYNIYNKTAGVFIDPSSLTDNSIVVKEGTEFKLNFIENDYNITGLILNDTDITSEMNNNSVTVLINDPVTTLKIEGTAREYGEIEFTGYIVNADEVNFSLSYGGTPFAIPEGVSISNDLTVDASLTMPAGETKKYVIPVSEKFGKFFFSPKAGYYISNLYTLTPEGKLEQHSGSASISSNIDGTIFYMMVEKLPEVYTADMTITGTDYSLRITAANPLSNCWNNPSNPVYPSSVGEREISFLPGYGTPIVFGFVGDESQRPAVYLDGGEVTGTQNENSGAIEYFVTPYSPTPESSVAEGVKSQIDVYNSFKERPTLSGASLQLEEGAEAEFFYSPVLHEANPEGQVVISGTQFTVRPASPKMVVTYKNQPVTLNENGEYVFNATGNARNNVVKVAPAPDAPVYPISPLHGTTVDNLSTITITFPDVEVVEYNDKPITLVGPQTNLSTIEVHGSANVWSASFRNPSIEGEYTVTFPAGAFTLDGNPSLEASATYTFKTGWQLLPVPGSSVENLNEIVLSFPTAKNVEYVGSSYNFVLSNGGSYASPGFNCTKVAEASVPTFSLTLPEASVPPVGQYTFTIEEGTFNIDGVPSAEIFVNYTIDREADLEYTQTPDGTIIYQDYGYDFAIIFEEGTVVRLPLDKSKVSLTFDGTPLTTDDYVAEAEMNMLMFMVLNTDYCKPGHLKLEIAEGAFSLGSTSAPAITAEWDVVAPKTYEVEVSTINEPDTDGKVNDLSEIYIYFPEATTGEVFQPWGAQLRTRDYSYSQSGEITLDESATEGVKFIVKFDPAPENPGQYSLFVNTGTMTLDGAFASPEIEMTFDFDALSGINAIYGDGNGVITVYSIDGKAISTDKIESLDKGIYVINGKKTAIK